jgi:hypothetical protein
MLTPLELRKLRAEARAGILQPGDGPRRPVSGENPQPIGILSGKMMIIHEDIYTIHMMI